MLCGDLGGRDIQKGGDVCVSVADSLRCAAETGTMHSIVKQLYPNFLKSVKEDNLKKEKIYH